MIGALRPNLLRCGYRADLVFDRGYKFSDTQSVDLAAFAHEPLDARSACIAAIRAKSADPKAEVMSRRSFGAPVIFACLEKAIQVWRPGAQDAELIEPTLSPSHIPIFFDKNQKLLAPNRIYTAKTIGRMSDSRQVTNLFVDAELLPYAERSVACLASEILQAGENFDPGEICRSRYEAGHLVMRRSPT
ncbi:MAG TPA: hypothetical protein VHP11_09780 [Tepidisphaeraceae bacterium]|nr:hypothetical protein [Tepidisphaeraceae bacterium]